MSEQSTVLITGVSRGIGRSLALGFSRAGYRVAGCFHRNREQAQELEREISAAGGDAAFFQADVSDPGAAKTLVEQASRSGGVDVLVNNAAVLRDQLLLRMTVDEWRDVMATDLDGPFFVLKECAKHMMRRKSGCIVNMASVAGVRGMHGGANYAGAKAGLIALTKSAAMELGRFGIRVNAVLPGFHFTDMGGQASAQYREKVLRESVLGTTTDIGELVEFILLLARSKTVSGQVFNWDSRII